MRCVPRIIRSRIISLTGAMNWGFWCSRRFRGGSTSVVRNGRIRPCGTPKTWWCSTGIIRQLFCGAYASTNPRMTMRFIKGRMRQHTDWIRCGRPVECVTCKRARCLRMCMRSLTFRMRETTGDAGRKRT